MKITFIVILAAVLSLSVVSKPAFAQNKIITTKYEVVVMKPHDKLLPQDATTALSKAISRAAFYKPGKFFVVSADSSSNGDWYIGSFTDTDLTIKNKQPQELYAYVVLREGKSWTATVEKDPEYKTIINKIPDNELRPAAKKAIFESDIGENLDTLNTRNFNEYKLPWTQGQTWQVTQGWYGSPAYGYSTNYSIDFDIVGANNGDILAMASGEITYKCFGYNNQGFLKIKTDGTNNEWGYLHISASSIQALGLNVGSHVSQGQKLGVMIEGNAADNCGHSNGTHFHLYFPYKPETLDGVTFSTSNSHAFENLTQSTNILTTGDCSGSSANVVLQGMSVNNGSMLECYATNSVTLKPTFIAQAGSELFITTF